MDLHKEDIPTLDFLLDLLVKRDSNISEDDLKEFDKYKEANSGLLHSEFKRLMYFFGHFQCGDPKNDEGLSEWVDINLGSAQFKHSGGFKNLYEGLEKDLEDKEFEKEKLEYSRTIRDQESRIRDLTENLKFMSLLKQYWWFIGACIGLGLLLRGFLDNI